jgi:hypothetical protein
MPYIRKNKCVFRKDTGKKVGCSDTVEKAKAYLKALYAAEDEEFDSVVNGILKENIDIDISD